MQKIETLFLYQLLHYSLLHTLRWWRLAICLVVGALSLAVYPSVAQAQNIIDFDLTNPQHIARISSRNDGTPRRGYLKMVRRGTVTAENPTEKPAVEFLGVIEGANRGRPLIMIRMVQQNTPLSQGMNGCPVYVTNGDNSMLLVGALSMIVPGSQEGIGLVTPIQDMRRDLRESAASPFQTQTGETSYFMGNGVGINGSAYPLLKVASSADPSLGALAFRPLEMPVVASGLSPGNMLRLAEVLRPFNMNVMQGAGLATSIVNDKAFSELQGQNYKPFEPGAVIGVRLVEGGASPNDLKIDLTALGTVTAEADNGAGAGGYLAFGHPLLQLGKVEMPVARAWVHRVVIASPVPYMFASIGSDVATLTQDRPFSVFLERRPPLAAPLSVTCTIIDHAVVAAPVERKLSTKIVNHPLLVEKLLPIVISQSLSNLPGVPADRMAELTFTADQEPSPNDPVRVPPLTVPTLKWTNTYYDPLAADNAIDRDLQNLLRLLTDNSTTRLHLKNVNVTIDLYSRAQGSQRPIASVEAFDVSGHPTVVGNNIEFEVGVLVRPHRGDQFSVPLRISVPVPDAARGKKALLVVHGGATKVDIEGVLQGADGSLKSRSTPPDADLTQSLNRLLQRGQNDHLVVRVIFPQEPKFLPNAIRNILTSAHRTSLKVELAEVTRKFWFYADNVTGDYKTAPVETVSAPDTRLIVDGVDAQAISVEGTNPTLAPALPTLVNLFVDGQRQTLSLWANNPPGGTSGSGSGLSSPSVPLPPAPASPSAPLPPARTGDPRARLVARPSSQWLQTSSGDFAAGAHAHTAVTTNGALVNAPQLEQIFRSDEQTIWSIVEKDGAYYVGTGPRGRILRGTASGVDTIVQVKDENGPDAEVKALLRDGDYLYAGTSPRGLVAKYDLNGFQTGSAPIRVGTLPEINTDPNGPKKVLTFISDGSGGLYAGTGPQGKIFRIASDGTYTLAAQLGEKDVNKLLLAPDGNLYAGCAESGTLYRINIRTGRQEAVFHSNQRAITGLALAPGGDIFVTTSPAGFLYRIEKDMLANDGLPRTARVDPGGTPHVVLRWNGPLEDLLIDRHGHIWTCSGNTVLQVGLDGTTMVLPESKRGRFTCLALNGLGNIVAGSPESAALYHGRWSYGQYTSKPFDAGTPALWGRISTASTLPFIPPDTRLRIETRSGNTPSPATTGIADGWSAWELATLKGDPPDLHVVSPPARFIQYRISFPDIIEPILVRSVAIDYRVRNAGPLVELLQPKSDEKVRGVTPLTWNVTDPDGDSLDYEITYSGDGGQTWHPIGVAGASTNPTMLPPPANVQAARTAYLSELDRDVDLSLSSNAKVKAFYEKEVDKMIRYYHKVRAASPPATNYDSRRMSGRLVRQDNQVTYYWNTTSVADGAYQVRLRASDRFANPEDPMNGEKVSEMFIVNNRPPQAFVFPWAVKASQTTPSIATGFIESGIPLKGVEYRTSDGPWTPVVPVSGIWNSRFVNFVFAVPANSSNHLKLELKLVDEAGNLTFRKATVRFAPTLAP